MYFIRHRFFSFNQPFFFHFSFFLISLAARSTQKTISLYLSLPISFSPLSLSPSFPIQSCVEAARLRFASPNFSHVEGLEGRRRSPSATWPHLDTGPFPYVGLWCLVPPPHTHTHLGGQLALMGIILAGCLFSETAGAACLEECLIPIYEGNDRLLAVFIFWSFYEPATKNLIFIS